MTATTRHEHNPHERPTWIVQSVFCNERPWTDFAYTIGLADRGVAELHLRCQPSLGDDPAPDWRFSAQDMCRILNEIAFRLLEGRVAVGDSWTHEYDDGLARVTFQLDPPEDREDLEAFGTDAGATVLPVRWSLERTPRGPRTALTTEERARLRIQLKPLRDGSRSARIPGVWRSTGRASFDPSQRYGPRTPLVLARAGQIWSADEETLAGFLTLAFDVEMGGKAIWPAVVAASAGRPLGLDDAVEELRQDVIRTVGASHPGRTTDTWARTVDLLLGDDAADQLERDRFSDALTRLFADAFLSALAAEVLGEDAGTRVRLAGLGPWLSATLPEGTPPGTEWLASGEVIAAAERLVDGLAPLQRIAVAARHAISYEEDPEYARVVDMLMGWAVTSAACAPVISGTSRWWSSCLTSALTHRMRLSPDEVEVFARSAADLAPELLDLLHSPI
ncbi:hypothetical protein GCM10027600_15830 [Nocardioides ginsengisegetis]